MKNKFKYRDSVTAYMMILPALAMLIIFVITPLFMAFRYSFFDVTFYKESAFVGLKNFSIILKTTMFRDSLTNAAKFVLIIVPGMMILSFALANILTAMPKTYATFVKTALYIPGIVSGIAVAVSAQ